MANKMILHDGWRKTLCRIDKVGTDRYRVIGLEDMGASDRAIPLMKWMPFRGKQRCAYLPAKAVARRADGSTATWERLKGWVD